MAIGMKWNRAWDRNMKVVEKTMKPLQFNESDCHGAVLNFDEEPRKTYADSLSSKIEEDNKEKQNNL